mgnify:FL=1
MRICRMQILLVVFAGLVGFGAKIAELGSRTYGSKASYVHYAAAWGTYVDFVLFAR